LVSQADIGVFPSKVTDLELRLAATEALLGAIAPWLDDEALRGVRAHLRADLIAARKDADRLVSLHALRFLDERFPPSRHLEGRMQT